MKRILAIIIVGLLCVSTLLALVPMAESKEQNAKCKRSLHPCGYVSEWNFTYNPTPYNDQALDLAVDSHNNIIVAGFGRDPNPYCYWNITKLDENGNCIWYYIYRGSSGGAEPKGVAVDRYDSFVVVGYYGASANSEDWGWKIVKFSKNNSILWEKNYRIASPYDSPTAVSIDDDRNIIVAGYYSTYSDYQGHPSQYGWLIMKFDPDGNSLWNRTYNFGKRNIAKDSAIDSDGNIIVVGDEDSTGTFGWRIMKFDRNGRSLWNYTRRFGPYFGYAAGVAVDRSNDAIVVAGSENIGQGNDQWRIMRFSRKGKLLWECVNDISPFHDAAKDVVALSSGNIVVVGRALSGVYEGLARSEWRIMMFGPSGSSLWNYTADISPYWDEAQYVVVDRCDCIIVGGFDSSCGQFDYQWRIIKFKPLEPATMIKALVRTIESWNLSKRIETMLASTLESACQSLTHGNRCATIYQLEAFINKVEAQRAKKLTNAQADYLINQARTIIKLVSAMCTFE